MTMPLSSLLLLLAGLLLGAACSSKLGGDLTINGEAFKPSECRNGSIYGFRGVELSGAAASRSASAEHTGVPTASRIRIAASMTGEAQVVIMPDGAGQAGIELGKCGMFQIADQNSTINDVKNVEGKATLDCSSQGFSLKGSVSFENCH